MARKVETMFISESESEYQLLKCKAALWDRFSPKLVGNSGEDYIARLILAERIFGNKEHDLVTRKKMKLEVKAARLTTIIAKNMSGRRWKWGKVFGNGGGKKFDRLILVGVREQPTNDKDWMIFDLSYQDTKRS
ncbi:MAG TPA: hypothetical protein VG097_09730 [Gemmata sp.]|jgi:hypothetical protein|nr:hypothetical protein [Gemmata sp.]